MDTRERENYIHTIGRQLAEALQGFYGSVRFNITNGRYINSNVEQSIKPETPEKGNK